MIIENEGSPEEEKYFSFEPNFADMNNEEEFDVAQSCNFFEKILEINTNF
jgi:hypothetical protein